MRVVAVRVLIVIALAGVVPSGADALVIEYQALDLADVALGEDLWEYHYFVSDAVFVADQGFSVYFDQNLYGDLRDPPPAVNADWSVLILQPDSTLPDEGLYDALALANAASLLNEFIVSFIWLGGASGPASQPWTLNQFDSAGNFVAYLADGRTKPLGQTVPEPSSVLLLAIGLAGTRRLVRRHP